MGPEFLKVAEIAQIQPGESKVIYVQQKEIAIFNDQGNFYAIENLCPHRGAPLSAGHVEDGVVTCPHHGARFDLKTGKGLKGPHCQDVKCFQVKVQGQDIELPTKFD